MFGLEDIRRMNVGTGAYLGRRRTVSEQLAGVDYVGKPKRVAHNTVRYERPDGSTAWRLHLTDVVVKHPDGTYELDSGGWKTVTTKDRINTYAPVQLFQRKHEWFVADGVPFEDGMIVNSDGSVREACDDPHCWCKAVNTA